MQWQWLARVLLGLNLLVLLDRLRPHWHPPSCGQVVYTRFETTRGLPIEYGTVHMVSLEGTLYEETFMDGGRWLDGGWVLFVLRGSSARKDVPCVRRQQ